MCSLVSPAVPVGAPASLLRLLVELPFDDQNNYQSNYQSKYQNTYQDDLITPVISPLRARMRKQMRHMSNLRR